MSTNFEFEPLAKLTSEDELRLRRVRKNLLEIIKTLSQETQKEEAKLPPSDSEKPSLF